MNPLSFLKNTVKEIIEGARAADEVQKSSGYYGKSVLDPRFKKEVKEKGVSFTDTPGQAVGAMASRALVDVANDGTRSFWWRWNNPFAIGQSIANIGLKNIESPTAKAAALLAITVPATASAGTYDITNPEEQFRPKGYAQKYSPVGAEDRRATGQPSQELFERFFLARTGDPLKYKTAKQDIPSLTPERYGNYLRYLYQDKGVLGLGVLKGTTENLQGYPEARLLGFPITLPMAGGFTGGAAGARIASSGGGTSKQKALRGIAGAAVGSLLGVTTGNIVNELIATGNRPKLPTVAEYEISTDKI